MKHGLFHKSRFEEVIRYEIFRSKRYKHPFSLILIKLVEAKIFCHKGAKQLEPRTEYLAFGKVMHKVTRETDLLFRLDEHIFAVVAPETNEKGATSIENDFFKRVETQLEKEQVVSTVMYEFTIQIGHASYTGEKVTAKELVKTGLISMKAAPNYTGSISSEQIETPV